MVKRKYFIRMLLGICLTTCLCIAPTSAKTEMQDRQAGGIQSNQNPAADPAARTGSTVHAANPGELRMTILYDNTVYDPHLKAHPGFAVLIEYNGHTLMFDTGAKGAILLHNMEKLGVEPRSVEAIVLSHEHPDHTGGLQSLLDKGIRPAVYVPSGFSDVFKKQVSDQARLIEVTNSLMIFPGVFTTQPVGAILEQALVVDTGDGIAVITGCAHPGIVRMVREAKRAAASKISLLAGGFHLMHADRERLQNIIGALRRLDVERILPTHCTGEEAITLFKTAYGKNYIEGGAGRQVRVRGMWCSEDAAVK